MEYETIGMKSLAESTKERIQAREQDVMASVRRKVGETSDLLPLSDTIDHDYVINLLKVLLDQIQKHRQDNRALEFSLKSSITSLLAKLEVDKMQPRAMPDYIKEEIKKHLEEMGIVPKKGKKKAVVD
ncbi:MAG: hypothetical protein KGZ39_00370 [Simkania sp.]|nr:hypothetical protein [Simkania sp.]